jgi:hypothetical protein
VCKAGRYLALHATVALIAAAASVRAQGTTAPGALAEIALPGGLKAALAAVDDGAAPDRSQFLLELIRRTYDTPIILKNDQRAAALQTLLAEMNAAAPRTEPPGAEPSSEPTIRSATGAADTVPLPLTADIWIAIVFGGRATPQTLVQSILGSRNASLFYYGLLSLDSDTRGWLSAQPQLIRDVVSRHPAAFVAAAPGLRVSGSVVRVPGGSAAEPAWEALVGRAPRDAPSFTRALLAVDDGALACFFGAIAQLTPPQIRAALSLDVPDPAARLGAAHRLYTVFAAGAWKVEERTFWRPDLDPTMLLGALSSDEEGRPVIPGTRSFWTAAFADAGHDDDDPKVLAGGDAADVTWLCEQIFKGNSPERRHRYNLVLFASRRVGRVTPATALDGVTAVRAAGDYPGLIATLEEAGLDDIGTYAGAARRAAQLSAIGSHTQAAIMQAQFQGIVALLARAASVGWLSRDVFAREVSSLSAVNLGKHGEYGGRLVHWLADFVNRYPGRVPGPAGAHDATETGLRTAYDAASDGIDGEMDRAVIRIAAGPFAAPARFVDWEGTRYRVDFATAEATRLVRLLGRDHPAYLTSARDLAGIADVLGDAALTPEVLRRQVDALRAAGQAAGFESVAGTPTASTSPDAIAGAYRDAVTACGRFARGGNVRAASRVAPALREVADELLARGLTHVAYAMAMGQPDGVPISVEEAASRHDLRNDVEGVDLGGAWRLAHRDTRLRPGELWHIKGALLGLDVALAEFSLVRLSSRPPSRRPTMSDEDRRVMAEAIALVRPALLTDAGSATVAAALHNGRERLAGVHTEPEASAVADEIGLAPARTSLLAWVAVHDPPRLAAFLAPVELLWLGLGKKPVNRALQAWGAPAQPRAGCLCLELQDRRPWETLAGRWNQGILASGFPDLNLRLFELLSGLGMPAQLLAGVLPAATADFNENAISRDPDDRRGPVDFVQALGADRVEQYLASLTTDGPLVPMGEVPEANAGSTQPHPGAVR